MSKRFKTAPRAENKKSRGTQKVVDATATPPVDSSKNEIVNPVSGDKTMQISLTRSTKATKSKAIRFESPSLRGVVRFPASAFTTVPDALTLEVADGALATGGAKPKLSKEERAAERAKLTPQDKARIAQERADRAVAKAKKLAAAV